MPAASSGLAGRSTAWVFGVTPYPGSPGIAISEAVEEAEIKASLAGLPKVG